jgi:hypothetical protein
LYSFCARYSCFGLGLQSVSAYGPTVSTASTFFLISQHYVLSFTASLDPRVLSSMQYMRNIFNGADAFAGDVSMWDVSIMIDCCDQGELYVHAAIGEMKHSIES